MFDTAKGHGFLDKWRPCNSNRYLGVGQAKNITEGIRGAFHRLQSLPRTISKGGLPRRHVKIREPVEMQLGILPETFPLFPPEIQPGAPYVG